MQQRAQERAEGDHALVVHGAHPDADAGRPPAVARVEAVQLRVAQAGADGQHADLRPAPRPGCARDRAGRARARPPPPRGGRPRPGPAAGRPPSGAAARAAGSGMRGDGVAAVVDRLGPPRRGGRSTRRAPLTRYTRAPMTAPRLCLAVCCCWPRACAAPRPRGRGAPTRAIASSWRRSRRRAWRPPCRSSSLPDAAPLLGHRRARPRHRRRPAVDAGGDEAYSPRLQVAFDTYRIPKQGERVTREVELRNVMAVLPGRTRAAALRERALRHGGAPGPGAGSRPRPLPGRARRQSASGGFDWSEGDNPAPGVNDDGSGTALTMELARVFAQSGLELRRHPRVHLLRGRGAGAGGGQAARAARGGGEARPSTACSTTTSWATGRAGRASRTPPPSACSRRDRRTRPRASSRARSAGRPPVYVPAPPRPAHRPPRPLRPRRRSHRLQPERLRRACASRRARRTTRASTRWTTPSRAGSIPNTWPGTRGSTRPRWPRSALAPAAPRGVRRARTAAADRAALRLRRAPALAGLAGRRVLPHLLARGLDAGLAVRADRGQRDGGRSCPACPSTTSCSAWPPWMPGGHESLVSAYVNPSRPDTPIQTLP